MRQIVLNAPQDALHLFAVVVVGVKVVETHEHGKGQFV